MLVWRISSLRHAAQAFSGEGGLKYPARWHHKGTLIVYTSSTLSLAALEMFANLKPQDISTELVAISAEIPDGVTIRSVDASKLPRNWREYPGPPSLQALGSGWVESRESAVLSVPSALIPAERNYLISPAHPDFRRLKIHSPAPFSFDSRMWKQTRSPSSTLGRAPASRRPPGK